MKIYMYLFILVISFSFVGCAKVFNPYESEFMCPDIPKGKCATMQQAYNESFSPADIKNEMVLDPPPCVDCDKSKDSSIEENPELSEAENKYKAQLYRKFSNNIRTDEKTPSIIPPKIMKMLVVNYEEDGDIFYGSRYVYFMSGKYTWLTDSIR